MDAAHRHHRRLDFWTITWFTGVSLAAGLSAAVICRRRKCSLCRGPIEGELESIQLSIVCKDCTVQYFKSVDANSEYLYTMSESDAIEKSGCLAEELSHLKHSLHNFKNGSLFKWQRNYLRSEVWFLRNLKRKEEVERSLGLKLKNVHPVVRYFLLGDYLMRLADSKTTLKDIIVYKGVIHQASEIVKCCRGAHPQAALDFCVKYPKASPREFEEVRYKMKKTFLLEGRRILHGLNENERRKLKNGPLGDVYEAFCAEESHKIVRGYLAHWFDNKTVDKIMADDGWVVFDWASGPEDRMAKNLKAFWMEKLHRKEELENALKERDLPMPDSCNYCKDYMNGAGVLDLSGVMACVDLARRMRTLGLEKETYEWTVGFDVMLHSLTVLKKRTNESIKLAMDVVIEEIEAQNQEENEEFW